MIGLRGYEKEGEKGIKLTTNDAFECEISLTGKGSTWPKALEDLENKILFMMDSLVDAVKKAEIFRK